MPKSQTVARSLNDLGLAAWFGGSLMGAVGLNAATTAIDEPEERARIASAGWMRWAPVNAAAIGAHLAGAAMLAAGNRKRIVGQHGVARWSTAKTVLTAAALASTAATGYFGQKVMRAGDVEAESATSPTSSTPPDVASAQRALAVLQWVTPALTGALIVVDARLGEQQRPLQVLAGVAQRLRADLPRPDLRKIELPHPDLHRPDLPAIAGGLAGAAQRVLPAVADRLPDVVADRLSA
jgi:hypothetical protein